MNAQNKPPKTIGSVSSPFSLMTNPDYASCLEGRLAKAELERDIYRERYEELAQAIEGMFGKVKGRPKL